MPAFELVRLRSQVDELLRYFTQPEVFRQHFRDLCMRYGDFALRSPNAAAQIPSYRLNPQVFEFIRVELMRSCLDRPAAAPALVRVLWKETYQEPMLLASHMLGEIPLEEPELVVNLILECADPAHPGMIQYQLFANGTRRLRREMPALWLDQIERWMDSQSPEMVQTGLRAMLSVIHDREFENLPLLFRILTPRMVQLQPETQAVLSEVLMALAERVPNEVTFFLRQFILLTDTPETNLRLIRKTMSALPEPFQSSLFQAFQARSSSVQGSE